MSHLNAVLNSILNGLTLVVLGIVAAAWRRRKVPEALPLAVLCLATAIYTFGYGMELRSQTLSAVDFWSKFQYIGLPFIPAAWVTLALSYTGNRRKLTRGAAVLLGLIPLLTFLFRWTNDWHHWHYGYIQMVSNGYFLVIDFTKGPWYYFHIIYVLLCSGYAFRLFWPEYRRAIGYRRQQMQIMLAGCFLPAVAFYTNLSGLSPLGLDSAPFLAAIYYSLLAYGILRYNLLHLIPLSRDKVFDWIEDGVLVLDLQLKVMDFNRAAGSVFPALTRAVIGLPLGEVLAGQSAFVGPLAAWEASRSDRGGEPAPVPEGYDITLTPPAGPPVHYSVRLSELYDRGGLVGLTVLFSDTSRQHALVKQLEYLARTDSLTGLLNPRSFIERVEYEISRIGRQGGQIALILVDIDHFKQVNDTHGHQAGDFVLQEFARTITANLRTVDLAGRYGGEEFILCLPDTGLEGAIRAASRIRVSLSAGNILWNGHPIEITASFGVTAWKPTADYPDTSYGALVKRADVALYLAKEKGRNRIESTI